MTANPVICFGQQPCGFFPKRFLVAKFRTARRLQQETGGEIVFFYHDSDHDPRETRTTLRHRANGQPVQLNFEFENKLQRKFSPLHLKRVPPDWRERTLRALPNYVDKEQTAAFAAVAASTVGDFCLDMYRRLGFIDGFRIVRSSDVAVRRSACDVDDFFVDVPYDGEIVRGRLVPFKEGVGQAGSEGTPEDRGRTAVGPGLREYPQTRLGRALTKSVSGDLRLHEGGDRFITLPAQTFAKEQISPTRDSRLRWMQSVLHCTHYVCGAGEQQYLNTADAPEIQYVRRNEIDRPDEAYTDIP